MTKITTRDKLIHAMADALQRKGLHGVGLNELLEIAGAPKGSLYHHFPGGKAELAVAAIEHIGRRIDDLVARLFAQQPDPLQALHSWLQGALQQLQNSRFERGCPLATVALESGPEDVEIRAALARCFATLRQGLARHLHRHGHAPEQADNLAALFVALYEGGLLQARVAGSNEPLRRAADALFNLTRQQPPGGDAA
ncbi:TetR/AcrR family transcriptional regulator [Pseudomonas lalucatii]|uniref:TetR/AcrR family transcriptional regulator n=1 Tax=Pseudomonas lalucatii TaxID=1424203 RepID=A0ABS5Q632_9PSED|nr:TetR/AcrR family transcriptional regulator [Pseudomonas lalucatii]MBS7664245.1 TetR/AcrR family transcriptional regulator [Pseudomonas lalucatii]MBS7725511.1 TetR/AcrR family transcriptional regulator [Pseudomonas lalucatii]QVM86548.1 TetR/AcrR family transcriptional regulator [Pseudomonas lalucatii]